MDSFQKLQRQAQAIVRLVKKDADNDILRALGLLTLIKDEWERELFRDEEGLL